MTIVNTWVANVVERRKRVSREQCSEYVIQTRVFLFFYYYFVVKFTITIKQKSHILASVLNMHPFYSAFVLILSRAEIKVEPLKVFKDSDARHTKIKPH